MCLYDLVSVTLQSVLYGYNMHYISAHLIWLCNGTNTVGIVTNTL